MKITEDTKSYYTNGLLVFLGCILCASYFNVLVDGLVVGILFLIFLVFMDNITSKETKAYTEEQNRFKRKSNFVTGSLFMLLQLTIRIRNITMIFVLTFVLIFLIPILYALQKEQGILFKKDSIETE
jgi:hypothetical protein